MENLMKNSYQSKTKRLNDERMIVTERLDDERMIVTERLDDERTINNVSKNSPSR